jgi:hypothetical protein
VADFWGGSVANGNAFRANYTFNRPADTTAYAAGDVVGAVGAAGAVHQLSSIGPAGAVAQIQTVRLKMSGTALPSGMSGGFRLHLFSAAPGSAADNAAFATTATERASYIDYIDIPTLEPIGGGFLSRTVNYVGVPFQLVTSSLWFELVTAPFNAFTPASGASIEVTLFGVALGLQG